MRVSVAKVGFLKKNTALLDSVRHSDLQGGAVGVSLWFSVKRRTKAGLILCQHPVRHTQPHYYIQTHNKTQTDAQTCGLCAPDEEACPPLLDDCHA